MVLIWIKWRQAEIRLVSWDNVQAQLLFLDE